MKKMLFFAVAASMSCLLTVLFAMPAMAQTTIDFSKSVGGSEYEYFNTVIETSDGGLIWGGGTYSNDGDVSGKHSGTDNEDAWLVKTDLAGNILWQGAYGGKRDDAFAYIKELSSGKIACVGKTSTKNNGDVTGGHGVDQDGIFDAWYALIDPATGTLIKQKCLGGTGNDYGVGITEDEDGNIALAISTESTDGDVTENFGKYDAWAVLLNADLEIIWQEAYGGSENDYAGFIIKVGSNYITGGNTTSNDGLLEEYALGGSDGMLVYANNSGSPFYATTWGGSGNDYFVSYLELNGNLIPNGTRYENEDSDFWSWSGNPDGTDQDWESIIGTTNNDSLLGACLAGESVVRVGLTETIDGKDAFISMIGPGGEFLWQASYGTVGDEVFSALVFRGNGNYLAAGWSNTQPDGHGGYDGWIVGLKDGFGVNAESISAEQSVNIYPNPISNTAKISFGNIAPTEYSMLSIGGQIIMQKDVVPGTQNTTLHCADLSTGTYFLRLSTDIGEIIKEVVVQR